MHSDGNPEIDMDAEHLKWPIRTLIRSIENMRRESQYEKEQGSKYMCMYPVARQVLQLVAREIVHILL